MSGIVYICESCRELLSETETVAEGVEMLPAGSGDVVEGHHAFFHPRHFPSGGRYRLVTRATTIDEALRRLGDR
jgi:hypothetical protein